MENGAKQLVRDPFSFTNGRTRIPCIELKLCFVWEDKQGGLSRQTKLEVNLWE